MLDGLIRFAVLSSPPTTTPQGTWRSRTTPSNARPNAPTTPQPTRSMLPRITWQSMPMPWQVANGPILQGQRLAPAVPFVLGGSFEVGELRAKSDLELARFRADIFSQIKDLPDGATIKLKLTDGEAG